MKNFESMLIFMHIPLGHKNQIVTNTLVSLAPAIHLAHGYVDKPNYWHVYSIMLDQLL